MKPESTTLIGPLITKCSLRPISPKDCDACALSMGNTKAWPKFATVQRSLADPSRLPDDELFKAVDYGDGSDQAFLRRLWHDLYGGEPRTSAT